jgi:hypothetical protein
VKRNKGLFCSKGSSGSLAGGLEGGEGYSTSEGGKSGTWIPEWIREAYHLRRL